MVWDKLKSELDNAAKATQGALQKAEKGVREAIDEGKLRLDAYKARQVADRDAQALGYAVFRAKKTGTEVDAETMNRLYNILAEHEAEAARLEAALNVTKSSKHPPAATPTDVDASPITPV